MLEKWKILLIIAGLIIVRATMVNCGGGERRHGDGYDPVGSLSCRQDNECINTELCLQPRSDFSVGERDSEMDEQ